MATKLYNRQGGTLRGIDIRQPMSPDLTGAKIVSRVAIETRKIADENYALGKSELINSVIDNAYTTAPSDPKKFDELVQDGLKKGVQDIPFKWQEEILQEIKPKVDATRQKVVQNTINRLDREHTDNVLATLSNIQLRMEDSNNLLINGIINQDSDAVKIAKAYDTKNRNSALKLSGLKNIKGSYIIGDKATRDVLATGQYGKLQAFQNAVNQLDLESLKSFDDTTFQARDQFKEAYGIDDVLYEKMGDYVAKRRKALGDEEKRIIKSQQEMNAAAMFNSDMYNEEELESYDFIPNDFKKQIKKAHKKYEGKINPVLADDSFLASVKDLEEIATFRVISPEDNEKLLMAGVRVLENMNKMGQMTGWDENKLANMQRSLYETVGSQAFADAIAPLYSDSKINDILSSTARRMVNIEDVAQFGGDPQSVVKDDFVFMGSSELDRAMKAKASEIIQEVFALAALGRTDLVHQRISDGNKELVRLNYSKVIPEWTFDELERKLEKGKPALVEINGRVWEFQGYDSKDATFTQKP